MARMIRNRRCVYCGEYGVQLWTIDNMETATVVYLCKEHGAPLVAIMHVAGNVPPEDQVPVPLRGQETFSAEVATRGRREQKMIPLLTWTPPGEPAPAPAPRAEPDPGPEREARVEVEFDSGFEPKVEPTVTIIKTKTPEQIAEETTVAKARAEGKTWTEVAELVGTSRQNVHQKYGKIYTIRGRKLPEDVT